MPQQTRALYVLDSTLLGWPGTGMYQVLDAANNLTQPLTYAATGQPFQFYEVSVVVDQGSWWLPTVPQNLAPPAWLTAAFGGVEALEATGTGLWTQAAGVTVLRAASALLWISEDALGQNGLYTPAITTGQVTGAFPSLEPSSPPD